MKRNFILLFSLFVGINLSSENYPTKQDYELIDFENSYKYLRIDTSDQNIWEIGIPHKIYFDSAFSKFKAITTNTLNYYPTNNVSSFSIYIGQFNYYYDFPQDIFIEFEHKFDTDTLKDGGYITVSYNNGKTWLNVINDSVYTGVSPYYRNYDFVNNMYSTNNLLWNGQFGFSGKSNGWVKTNLCWFVPPVKSAEIAQYDTMILRFNFTSDSIPSKKEGWLIDNIRLYSARLPGAISAINNSDLIKLYPNPAGNYLYIDLGINHKFVKIEISDVQGRIQLLNSYYNIDHVKLKKLDLKSGFYNVNIYLDNYTLISKKLEIK